MTTNLVRQDNRRFQRHSAVYTCVVCGKRTRETGEGESSSKLCLECWQRSGWENTHSDSHDTTHTDPNCPFCKEESE